MNDHAVRLRMDRVCKSYPAPAGGGAVDVLRDVTLDVNGGDSVAIVGPSGSGKSTLLSLMGAMDSPTRGVVSLGGRDLAGMADRELAAVRSREIGFVFQAHRLLPHCTVLENVLVPTLAGAFPRERRATADERARRLLDDVGLARRLHHRPGELSGGECQRVAVARALIGEPGLLLADEPTGSLDHANATRLADLLAWLNREKGVAVVVVTHSRDVARRMARRFALEDGQLVPDAS